MEILTYPRNCKLWQLDSWRCFSSCPRGIFSSDWLMGKLRCRSQNIFCFCFFLYGPVMSSHCDDVIAYWVWLLKGVDLVAQMFLLTILHIVAIIYYYWNTPVMFWNSFSFGNDRVLALYLFLRYKVLLTQLGRRMKSWMWNRGLNKYYLSTPRC